MVAAVGTGARVGSGSGGGLVGKRNVRRPSSHRVCCPAGGRAGVEVEKARDPRINGAGIYVARMTKSGMGSAIVLAVRRVVSVGGREAHWNGENDKFDEVKVNTAERGQNRNACRYPFIRWNGESRSIIPPPHGSLVFLMLLRYYVRVSGFCAIIVMRLC